MAETYEDRERERWEDAVRFAIKNKDLHEYLELMRDADKEEDEEC